MTTDRSGIDTALHRVALQSDTDPGRIGAGRAWVDGQGVLSIRDATDSQWIVVAPPAVIQGADPNTVSLQVVGAPAQIQPIFAALSQLDGNGFRVNADGSAEVDMPPVISGVFMFAVTSFAGAGFRVLPSGDIEVNTSAAGLILHSPDGVRHRVTVGNDGVLVTTPL